MTKLKILKISIFSKFDLQKSIEVRKKVLILEKKLLAVTRRAGFIPDLEE